MAKFGERLRHLRTSHDLSQMELAKCLKISKSSVNMYERCEREPNLVMLEVIADFFNVDLDYLLGKSEQPNKYSVTGKQPAPNTLTNRPDVNILRLAGRDGSYREKVLTDHQMAYILEKLAELPEASDDL